MRNGALWSSFLVMAIAVAVAAALQEFLPPIGALRLKFPLLSGVAVYYAMRRDGLVAAIAAIWCGAAEDGISGVPGAASLVAICAVSAFFYRKVKPQMEECALSCAVCGAAFAPILSAIQYLALRLGGMAPLPALFIGLRVAASILAGFAASFVVAKALHALDWISANVEIGEEDDDAFDAI